MNKIKKIMMGVLVTILVVGSLIAYNVFAEEGLKVIKISSYDGVNSILYSDNTFVKKNQSIENVKDIFMERYNTHYLTLDNKLVFMRDNGSANPRLEIENVEELQHYGTFSVDFVYKKTDNSLYGVNPQEGSGSDFEFTSSSKLITEDAAQFKLVYGGDMESERDNYTVLFTNSKKELYGYGYNYFGKRINDGASENKAYKILDNIKEFNTYFALSEDGSLYHFASYYTTPKKIADNVKTIKGVSEYSLQDYTVILGYELNDGTNKLLKMYNDRYAKEIIIEDERTVDFKIKEIRMSYILSEDNTLYHFSYDNDKELETITDDVKSIQTPNKEDLYNSVHEVYILKNNGDLYYTVKGSNYVSDLVKALTHKEKYDGLLKLLSNVSNIDCINDNFILLSDGSILKFGDSNNFIPVKLNDRINNNKDINALDIVLGIDKNDISPKETTEGFATVVPFNAVDKTVTWTSSNPSVATVANGTITGLTAGTTNICATLNSNSKIKECSEITVHSPITGIEISEGEEITVNRGEYFDLNAKILPEDALEENVKIEWNKPSGLSFYPYEDKKKINLSADRSGTYTITVTLNDQFTDSITVNVSGYVEGISLNLDYENYDGKDTIFIDMANSNELELNYDVVPSTASNKTINWYLYGACASIENNKITASCVGRETLNAQSEDGNFYKQYNLVILNSNSTGVYGDVNGDGKTDLQDLVDLRKYLAEMELNN